MKMRKTMDCLITLIVAGVAYCLSATVADAQCSGIFNAGNVCGNSTASGALAGSTTPTAIIDRAIGSTRGSILERGASTWGAIVPGTTAYPWVSNGAGSDPAYQQLTGAGMVSNTVGNAQLRQGVARSVIGVAGNATANVADIQGTTDQILRIDGAGTGLGFGSIDLSKSAAVGTSILGLANGGLGGSQAAATANQIPVYPGSAGAAAPTSAATWFDNFCSNTIGYVWARFTGGWACGANGIADVRYWGALCNASANDTTAINTAFASGAKWFLIPGTCNVTGLNSPPQGSRISGVSRAIGILQTTSGTLDVLPITTTYVSIDNLGFKSTVTRTAGSYVNATGASYFSMSDFDMIDGFNGIYVASTAARFRNGNIYNMTGTRIIINGGNEQWIDTILGDNTVGNAVAGIDIQASGAVFIINTSIIKSGNGLNIQPSGTNVVSWVSVVNSLFDTGTGAGIFISPTGTAKVLGFYCNTCWASSNLNGVSISKAAGAVVDGIEFVSLRVFNNTQRGVLATAGLNLSFIGGAIAGNSIGASGTLEGMAFDGVNGLRIEGVASGGYAGFSNSQSYNLAISGTTDQVTITGNYLCGFTTGAFNNTASGANKTIHSNGCAINTGTIGSGPVALGTSPIFITDITTPKSYLSGTSNQLVFQSAGVTGTMSWAPASTNKTLTWPNGTTDFTATGGASNVVKQVSAGAALTVGQLACADLSNAGGFCSVSPSQLTNALGANVLLNNTALFFDGPTIAQGTSGTWWASGSVTVYDVVAPTATIFCKLWDGTTIIASGQATTTLGAVVFTLAGYIASPAANIKVSCKDQTGVNGVIAFNQSGTSKDSTISAFRIQ